MEMGMKMSDLLELYVGGIIYRACCLSGYGIYDRRRCQWLLPLSEVCNGKVIFTKMENIDWDTGWTSECRIFSLKNILFHLPGLHLNADIK